MGLGPMGLGQVLEDPLTYFGKIDAEANEHLRAYALSLPNKSKQHVFRADVVVSELQCLAQRQLHDFLRSWGEGR